MIFYIKQEENYDDRFFFFKKIGDKINQTMINTAALEIGGLLSIMQPLVSIRKSN